MCHAELLVAVCALAVHFELVRDEQKDLVLALVDSATDRARNGCFERTGCAKDLANSVTAEDGDDELTCFRQALHGVCTSIPRHEPYFS